DFVYPAHGVSYCSSSFFFLMSPRPTRSTLFPYTTLFRSRRIGRELDAAGFRIALDEGFKARLVNRHLTAVQALDLGRIHVHADRSEEHTSELQSRGHLVCRLLLEKKKHTNLYGDHSSPLS